MNRRISTVMYFGSCSLTSRPHFRKVSIIDPNEGNGLFNSKIEATSESYALKVNSVIIITRSYKFTPS